MPKKETNVAETENKKEYSATIVSKSENLTNQEVLSNLNTDVMDQISTLVGSGVIAIKCYIVLRVYNPFVKDADSEEDYTYYSYVYLTDDGNSYYTSSESFHSSFQMIQLAQLQLGVDGSTLIEVVEKKSNNNQGSMLLAKASF